ELLRPLVPAVQGRGRPDRADRRRLPGTRADDLDRPRLDPLGRTGLRCQVPHDVADPVGRIGRALQGVQGARSAGDVHHRRKRPGGRLDHRADHRAAHRVDARPSGEHVSLSATQLAVAFAAGVVSIISPCVWPLVPGYLSLVSGVPARELEDRRAKVVGAATGFVAGFTVIFTLAGAGAGILGSQFLEHRRGLELISGAIVIAMGIVMLAPRWLTFLQRQARLPMQFGHDGALWAGLAGAAFAIGSTPCIGPTLGAILTVAGTEGRATDGAVLLFAYSLGLAIP